jgi:hypothetical protein
MHRPLLVVASVQVDGGWVQLLPREEGESDLDAAVAAINKVAVEEVGMRRRRKTVRAESGGKGEGKGYALGGGVRG